MTGTASLQAVEERNSAQVRIAAAEDTATQAFEEVGNMRDEVADLKERLTKVHPTPCSSAIHASCMLLPASPCVSIDEAAYGAAEVCCSLQESSAAFHSGPPV